MLEAGVKARAVLLSAVLRRLFQHLRFEASGNYSGSLYEIVLTYLVDFGLAERRVEGSAFAEMEVGQNADRISGW